MKDNLDILTAYVDKPKPKVVCGQPTKTKQSLKRDCDINYIVDRFLKTGILDHVASSDGYFSGDFVCPTDYQNALEVLSKAEEQFEALPVQVRSRYSNLGAFMKEFDGLSVEDVKALGLTKEGMPVDQAKVEAVAETRK